MSTPPVTIYSLTTCGWSRKAKEYFKQRGIKAFVIEYDTVGPELQQKISAEMRKEGADGFPFVRIAGKVVKGYDPAAYDRLLKAACGQERPEERREWPSRSRSSCTR